MMRYILVIGTLVDGFTFVGPFSSHTEATDNFFENCKYANDSDWHIARLHEPITGQEDEGE